MAFNINAQVVLSGPKNLNKISKQIQQGIGKSGTIKVAVDSRSLRNIRALNTTVGNLNTNITNLNNSANTLKSTLSGVNSGLSKANSTSSAFNKNQQQTASSVNNVNNALQQQSKTLGTLGKRFVSTAKTAVAFGLISRPIYDLQRAFIGATKDAVEFQKEIVKISQVTGTSVKNLTGLSDEINRLATTLGVSANELAETSRIIAQTGRSAAEIQPILNALARSTLAPTFGKITDTTEGLIAALGQFQLEASQSEQILGSLNRVSKNFAVEAEDLISVIRRTGGVFAQAAGDSRNTVQALQELAAIFTAVRSTTRESADTIAAGLRTIFSRIQRRGTIEFLEQFGVQLTNVKGEFIGIFPAFDELSRKLSTLIQQGDALTLSAIAEELGGIRQIGKLLPAIAQFDKARAALEQAQKGAVEGLGIDVAKGLDTVDNRIRRVKESFDELIRTVFESDAFQNFTKGVLTSAESILKFGTKVVESLEPILPLLQGIGAVKLGQAIGGFVGGGGIGKVAGGLSGQAAAQASQAAATASQSSAQATQANTQVLNTINATLQRTSNQLANIFQSLEGNFRTLTTQMSNLIQAIGGFSTTLRSSSVAGFAGGVRRRSGGGKILGFNRGGMVPGTGNGDTVPAMLEPGEFVIKKSSVNSIGAGQLASMNKYADGGKVTNKFGAIALLPVGDVESQQGTVTVGTGATGEGSLSSYLLRQAGGKRIFERFPKTKTLGAIRQSVGIGPQAKQLKTNVVGESFSDRDLDAQIGADVDKAFEGLIANTAKLLGNKIGATASSSVPRQILNSVGTASTIGSIFEGSLSLLGAPFDRGSASDEQDPFDFPSGIGSKLTKAFPSLANLPVEAKRDLTNELMVDIANRKATNFIGDQVYKSKEWQSLLLEATRGPAKTTGGGSEARRRRLGFASGGGISGQDTVPALLTPGEFVFNKKAAGSIGYSTLNAINKKGVQGFNKGGVVGIQRFANGGQASGGGGRDFSGAALGATFAITSFTGALEDGVLSSQELNNLFLSLAPSLLALKLSNNDVAQSNNDVAQSNDDVAQSNDKEIQSNNKATQSNNKATQSNNKASKSMTKFDRAAERGRRALERAAQAAELQARVQRGEITKRQSRKELRAFDRQQRGPSRFAGAGLGLGIAASAVGTAIGGTTGGAISGAGAGAAIGSLLGPVGTAVGALSGAILGLENAITEQETQARQKAFEFALQESVKATQNLEKAILENISSAKLLTQAISKSGDLSASGEGSVQQAIAASQAVFNENTGPITAIGVTISKSIEMLGDSISEGSFERGGRVTQARAAGKGILDASDALNKLGDQQLKNLTVIGKATNLNLQNVDSLTDFKKALGETNLSAEQSANVFNGLEDIVAGILPEYNAQIDALRGSNKITKEQANLAKRALFNIGRRGISSDVGQEAASILAEEFEGLIDQSDITKQALNELKEGIGTLDNQIQSINLQKPLQLFNIQLNEVTKTLKLSNAVTKNTFDNFERSLQTLSGNFQSISQINPFDFQGAGAGGLKLQGISQIGRQTGADVSGLESTQRALNQVPQIAQQLLMQTEGQESFRAEEIADFFQRRFEAQQKVGINAGLPDEFFVAFIGTLKDSLGRQGADIPAEVLRNAIETDQLDEIFGKIGADSQAAFSELFKSVQDFNDNFAKQVNIQAQILSQQKDFDLSVLQKRQQLEVSLNDILGRRVSGGLGAARGNLQAQTGTLAGTSDPTEIIGKLLSARSRLSEIRTAPDTGSLEEASQLTSEIQSLTKALNLLGNDTTQLAAIQQEATKVQQQQIAAQSSLEGIILGAASGDTGAMAATIRQQEQLFRTLEGGGSIQDQVAVLQNLQNADFATLVDAIGRQRGVEGGADVARESLVQNLTQALRGTPFGKAIGPTLDVLSKETKDTSLKGLATEANKIANEQLTILKVLAGIDIETKNDLAKVGADQLKAQEETIKQQTKQLNFLNKSNNVTRRTTGSQQTSTTTGGPPTSREIASGVTAGGIPLPSAPASSEISPFERAVMATGVAAEDVLSPAALAAEKARKAEREQKLSGFATSVDARAAGGNLFATEQRRQQEAFLRVQESGTPAQQRQLARRQEGFAVTPFQQQQQQKRSQFQLLQESRRLDVQVRKGEITGEEKSTKLQEARKRLGLTDNLGFDKAKQEQQLKPGELIKNSLLEGSTEGAKKYDEVFSKLPESIKVELQPIEIIGTDSIGTAIGDQLLPKIQEILQPLINQNDGIPIPQAGAGT